MYRKWKRTAALGLAVLIGGMMPMGTMLAAEDNTEVVQETDSVSDADAVPEDETISDDNESSIDEVKAEEENIGDYANTDDENVGDETKADEENAADEVDTDDVNADEEADTIDDQNAGIQVMTATEESETGDIQVLDGTEKPVIDIKFNGQSYIYGMGGTIDYQYVNNADQAFEITAGQEGQEVSFSYYLDRVENLAAGAKSATDINWPDTQPTPMRIVLSSNENYVLYVKAVAEGQTVYARSGGVVVDTIAPKIVGVEDGRTYSAGTTFTVSDANLSEVLINEQKAEPLEGGKYKIAAQASSTSCVIRAKDKAGNSASCTITVSGSETPDTGNVISESKVYSLKAGVKYHLAAGNWKVDGDMSIYQGNSDFYVKGDGDYIFSK